MLSEAERRKRECIDKKRYSRYWAFLAADSATRRSGKKHRIYHCSYGDHWHITKTPKQRT